jgi:hypothetical protein
MEARAQLPIIPLRAIVVFFAVVLALTLAAGAGYVARGFQAATTVTVSAPASSAPADHGPAIPLRPH